MELNTHIIVAITFGIVRNNEVAIIQAKIRVTYVGLYDEVTFGIVAARSTYYINKCLVVRVLDGQILSLGLTPIIPDMDLVSTSEGHTVVIVGKLAGNVKPQQGQLLVVLVLVLIGGATFKPLVVVGIDDDFQIIVKTPAYHLLNTC